MRLFSQAVLWQSRKGYTHTKSGGNKGGAGSNPALPTKTNSTERVHLRAFSPSIIFLKINVQNNEHKAQKNERSNNLANKRAYFRLKLSCINTISPGAYQIFR